MKSQIFAAGTHMESLLIQLATPAAFELATFSLEAKRLTRRAWPWVRSQTFWRTGPGGFTHVAAGTAPHQRNATPELGFSAVLEPAGT
jgi:hypothetical protein